MEKRKGTLRWFAALACAAALAACGGGGAGGAGGAGDSTLAAGRSTADSRNGDYVMYAGDAREYTLSLDFDARTYRVRGNGQDLSGTIAETATPGRFGFDRTSGIPATPNAPRLNWFQDTVVGGFHLPSGTVPFIAARSFVTTLADAAGSYNVLVATRDTAGPPNNTVFSAELLASGRLRTCTDFIIRISRCASVAMANITIDGNLFTADTGTGSYSFRIARVGSERIYLRAGASGASARRLEVGIPEGSFADGNFNGANSRGDGTSAVIDGATYRALWHDGTNKLEFDGTIATLGAAGPVGMAGIITADQGRFFAIRNSELIVLMAGPNNASVPGYVEFGKN